MTVIFSCPEILTTSFQYLRQLLPVVSLELPMLHSHPQLLRNLAVPITRQFHECFIRSTKELPAWLNGCVDAFVHLS